MAGGAHRGPGGRTAGHGGPAAAANSASAIRGSFRAGRSSAWESRARWQADPPLLLFDEPFAALDPITRVDLQRLFLDLRRRVRKTALFVTHDIREAMMLGSRIALLKDGALELLAEPKEFRASQNEEARAFLASLETNGEAG